MNSFLRCFALKNSRTKKLQCIHHKSMRFLFNFNQKKSEDGKLDVPDLKKKQEIGTLLREFFILNVSPQSSVKEIYAAYKRNAVFYNPNVYFEYDVKKEFFYKI